MKWQWKRLKKISSWKKSGIILAGAPFLERLTAQRDLFDARNNLVQSKYNYLIEMANLENEIGTPVVGNPE